MKYLVLVCNIVALAFTLLVIGTDGLATQASYIALTLLLIIIPFFTILALARPHTLPGSSTTTLRFAAIANLILLGFVCWALVDQHPHPTESGFVPYAVLMVLTPLLSAVTLFRYKPNQVTHV